MPINISTNKIKIKDGTEYISFDVMSDETTAERIADINAAGQDVLDSIPSDYTELSDDVDQLKSDLQAKLDEPSVAGTSGQVLTSDGEGGQSWEDPTDTITIDPTLSIAGAAADAKATGDAISLAQDGYIGVDITTNLIENKSLLSSGFGEMANNGRMLSDFIPVTAGDTLYIDLDGASEYCGFYSDDDYADLVGTGAFGIPAGHPSTKVIPDTASYLKIGWKASNGTPVVYVKSDLRKDVDAIYTASASDEGKALKAKTVSGGRVTEWEFGEAGGGTTDYTGLTNKPSINSIALSGNKTGADLGLASQTDLNNVSQGKIVIDIMNNVIANKVLTTDGKDETANNNRYLSDFIPVTEGTTIYIDIGGESQRCAFYTAANYDDVTGSVFTIPTGHPSTKVVPTGAKYFKFGWHKTDYATPTVYTIVPIINDTAGSGALYNVWSADKSASEVAKFQLTDTKVNNVGKYVNYELVDTEFGLGFYNDVTGAWTANNSFGTLKKFPVQQGDCYLVTGKVPAADGFALVIIFDSNGNIVGKVFDGSDGAASVKDYFVYVSQSNAAYMAVLGQYYDSAEYYPIAKRAILKFAHQRKLGVCFGDSTFGNANATSDIPSKLSVKTENTVLNGAFGGCRMSYYNGNYGAFSMYNLADAICTGTWTAQDAAMADTGWEPPAYAADHLANLKNTDFDEVDFITIAYGTNDWRAGNPLDNQNNKKDTGTIAGALRYSLEEIMTTYPQIDIYVLCPIWRVVALEGDTEDNPTGYCDTTPNNLPAGSQYYLMDVCNKLKDVCGEYHVTFVNNFDIGINQYNWKNWLQDGTHPNDNGRDLMTDNMIKNIKGI